MAQISTEDDVWPPSAQAQSSTTFRHTDNSASTLSLPPANRSGSDEQPTKPSILTSEIHREVMGLLILVAKQDASPMRSSKAKLPSHDRTELTDSSKILAMQSDTNNDTSRATASHSDDQQTWHFDALEWRQQKGLLQRIIRRLRGWDEIVRGDDEEDNRYLGKDKETEKMAEIYFSTIGKALIEMLRDDSHFKEHIDRIKNLLNSQVYQETTKRAEAENDPYQNLEAATNGLFDLLRRPLMRKRTRDFASIDSPPIKRSRSLTGNLKAVHNEENYNNCVDSPSQEEYVSSSEEEHTDSSPDHEKSRHFAVERHEPEAETIDQKVNPEHKIILRFVTQPNAIQETTDSTNSLNNQEIRSKDISLNLPGNTEEKCISQLGKNFAAFGIETSPETSSYPMAKALLDFAQIAERPDAEEHCLQFNPELWQFLDQLNSIIALIASLPDWQLFIIPDQNYQAKEAASMIYLILLEEAISCVTDVSLEFRRQIMDSHSMDQVMEEMHFFCVCLRRLSGLVEKHEKTFHRFQLFFREILDKYGKVDGIVYRRTVLEKEDFSETGTEDSQNEDDPAEDSQIGDNPAEGSQIGDDPAEGSQIGDDPAEGSQIGDNPAEDSQIGDDSDEHSWIEDDLVEGTETNNDCVQRPGPKGEYLRTEIRCLEAQRRCRPLSIACYLSTDSNRLQSDLARLAGTEFPGGFQAVTVGDLFEESELETS